MSSPLWFVQQYLSLYHFPSPSPSASPSLSFFCPQLPSHYPSHRLVPSLSWSLLDCPTCSARTLCRHCHCHRQDGSTQHSALLYLPSPHHHPHQFSHTNSVVKWPGSRLACTASSLAPQSFPWHYYYHTKWKARSYVSLSQCWLFADWSDWFDPRRHWGCPTSNWLFGHGFWQTLTTNMSGRLSTTSVKANCCSCGTATLAGIVKSGESWLDQERLSHKQGPMPSRPCSRKHCISV